MKILFLLIDALNMIRRVYEAQPGQDGDARVTDALRTVHRSVERALSRAHPTHVAAIFDSPLPGWRHALYPAYKEGRPPMPDPLRAALPRFEETFTTLSVPVLSVPESEADDIIATLACKTAAVEGASVVILSTDKMFLQLLSERIGVYDHFENIDRDCDYVKNRYGITPAQLVDYFALAGNASSNIKGVPLIGTKGAERLLREFGDLETILGIAPVMKGKVGESLRAHESDARCARQLLALRTDIVLGSNLHQFRYVPQDNDDRNHLES